MIVDSSALMAILLGEPERAAMLDALSRADRSRIAAPNWLETRMVFDGRRLPSPPGGLDAILRLLAITVVPFDHEHAEAAHRAFMLYGRGSQHPARLNFGDCMAYALAKSAGEPLLFKGDDFIHTDIEPALT